MDQVRVDWHGPKVRRKGRAGANRGLKLAGEHLLAASNAVVPIEEHILEASGKVTPDTENLRVAVSYDTVYAVRQHEELEWRHDPGRQAKYLEGPYLELRSELLEIVAAQIRRALDEARKPGRRRRR